MIKIENVMIEGFEPAIRGMRNPMNSWEKSDSKRMITFTMDEPEDYYNDDIFGTFGYQEFAVGPNDLDLMKRLAKAGVEHATYRRMIAVWLDITAPLYWWKEMDRYTIGKTQISCSTMHKIAEKEFSPTDFSVDHLLGMADLIQDLGCNIDDLVVWNMIDLDHPHYEIREGAAAIATGDFRQVFSPFGVLGLTIDMLNRCRELYLQTKDKKYWWQLIQLLPSSYNQKRTVMLNYEVLYNMYHQRKDHKLDEWRSFCDWIEALPYAKEVITLEG